MIFARIVFLFLFFSCFKSEDLRACTESGITQDRLGLVNVAKFEIGKPVSYTQNTVPGDDRWSGINLWVCPFQYESINYPPKADCSSFVSWIYWVVFGLGDDFVNGQNWNGGATGSLSEHGTRVSLDQARPGDIVIYGVSSPYTHATLYIGNGRVISFGGSHPPDEYDIDYSLFGTRAMIISHFMGCLSDNECVNHVEGGETICYNGGVEITPSNNGYCTTGCHTNWDCPEGKVCDTTLTTWQCVATSNDCYGPDGSVIVHGESKIYYLYNDPCNYGCDQYEYRECDNGYLSGGYQYPFCSTEGCSSGSDGCYGPGGIYLENDDCERFYSTSSVSCDEVCYDYSEFRCCRDGVLSGSYEFVSCSRYCPPTPTSSPPPSPPPSPPEEENCFASDSFVFIQNGEKRRLYEVEKGDMVETDANTFSIVYHIKHHLVTHLIQFHLQSSNNNEENLLEITPNHLVYMNSGELMVASNVTVGDFLRGKERENGWKVVRIENVEKPSTFILTNDYQIYINGVQCSVFTCHALGTFGSVILKYTHHFLPEFVVDVIQNMF